jgi:hypothetical protein
MACEPDSTTVCTAVGKKTTGGVSTPYAQHWNGSSWANQSAAAPAGATASELQSNHCLSKTSCVAAGHYTTASGTLSLVESWNGTSWSIQATPNPTGANDTRLKGVSCKVITACIAVGYSGTSPVAMRGNSGTWTLQTFPVPTGATSTELNGVECMSATSCVAVGRYTVSGGAHWAMSATWDGTSWTLKTVPKPSGALRSVLLDVSCSDPSNCTAVGGYRNSSNVQVSFAVRWNGTAWTHHTTPNPTGSSNTVLQNISCADQNWCVAVGDWLNSGTWQPMAQSWNGSSWSLDSAPSPTGATFGLLEGVACRISCMAIGWYTDSAGVNKTLGEVRSTPSWIQKTLPTPLANEALRDITCYHSNGCFAVGTGASHARIYSGGSGSWIHFDTPEPSGATFSQLRGVHCITGDFWCAAVGTYTPSGGSPLPYAATDADSGAWDVHAVPTPGGASGALNDVYCFLSLACMGVGHHIDGANPRTFASFWNGSTWTTRTPLNVGSDENVLKGVSCPTSSLDCIAVGYARVNGVYQPMVQRWSSFTWAIHTSPLPSGVSSGRLHGVSCTITSPVTCMAVGEADSHTYAVRWNGSGSTWTVVAAPRPAFAQVSHFEDVSCASPTACVAVGHYTLSSGARKTFAAEWDGSGWTLHSTPNPGTSANELLGVSCVTSTVCRGAGYGVNSGSFNLVATFN